MGNDGQEKPSELQDRLMTALSDLEEQLETPFAPGEMPEWVQRVERGLGEVATAFKEVREASHSVQLQDIAEIDPDQLPQIERLQAEDESITLEAARLSNSAAALSDRVAMAERAPQTDESQIASLASTLIDDGVALVVRIRKQEHALQTWNIEAFYRDRGVAD